MMPRLAAVARGPARASLQRAADCVGRIVAVEVRNTLVVLASARRACATLTLFQLALLAASFALVWHRFAQHHSLRAINAPSL